MSLKQNIIRARSHFVFTAGLLCAFALAYSLETIDTAPAHTNGAAKVLSRIEFSDGVPDYAKPRALTDSEMKAAEIAWQYFENNYQPATGLVNSVDGYPAATLWDTSSYMMGLICAHRLDIIDEQTFDNRVAKLLGSLQKIDLFDGQLPNKSYNTETLSMVNYDNSVSERGIGWSAIDIGRVLVPFNVLAWNYPKHTLAASAILQGWDFDVLVASGELIGAQTDDESNTEFVQEGRLGYEEYAAKSLMLMGSDVATAMSYEFSLDFVDVYGLQIGIDSRNPEIFNAHNYVVSEPYILDGIEYGWDTKSRELAWRVFSAQQRRYEKTGQLTAVSEDNIDQAPYFVYNTVYTSGKVWNTITESGEDASEFKSVSTKAAFGWHALYGNAYTAELMDYLSENHDEDKGWFSGIYESSGKPNKAITANTNGIILETLAYTRFGKLVSMFGGGKS